LEGKEVTSVQEVQATITDGNGDKQPAYIASFTVEGKTIETEVFKRYGSYYYIDEETGNEVLLESELEDDYGSVPEITYTEEMTEGEAVVGYEGENRVWTEDQMTEFSGSGTSTTQGNGSCYVFYADTPSDQTRFLNLLSAMKVSFVNKDGRQIGVASMDTEHYYAENGKVTVPLVLDTTMATNLGIDIDGNTIYGMMPLTKGAATRITAIIYLDGTKLTNGMVLANGDIQGSLNIQFGCTTATQITTTVEDAETGETETDVEYTQGTASSAIRNEEVMDDFIAVTASVTKDSFDYDPDQTASTTVNVNVTGIQPQSVSIRFIRAISSTQGALQEMVNLSGSGSSWNGTYSFNKPGTYILRSVWVDGVEYTLEEPQTVTVTGSSVNSLTCDAITDGRSATVLTADSSYSTNVTLGFATSNSMPNSVKGMFMDANGRQVNVTFTKNKDGVTWSGKATFTSSATYTMSYVEIDGNIYELSESLQPTLEVLLGLKVRTWITVSDETLAKLQEKDASALATRFTLTEDVTLNVAAEIYDNSGNEIMGLDDVTLIYGKSGSALKKLDGNLKWDTGVGRYSGEFLVHEAGTYKFSSVTVGNNTITNATSAPNIQAMPPEDVSYFNNYTETYQYAPQLNAKMTIGLAYSSAASKVEATINNGTNSFVVEGEMGHEAEDQGDKTVNLWSFKVPEINSSQEGEWKLTSITLYDVYYGGQYYAEENGATIDVSSEEIKTKVINYIYATLKGNSQEFSGYFMDDHKVSGMTVTIADYE
jgi:hypothetical protein